MEVLQREHLEIPDSVAEYTEIESSKDITGENDVQCEPESTSSLQRNNLIVNHEISHSDKIPYMVSHTPHNNDSSFDSSLITESHSLLSESSDILATTYSYSNHCDEETIVTQKVMILPSSTSSCDVTESLSSPTSLSFEAQSYCSAGPEHDFSLNSPVDDQQSNLTIKNDQQPKLHSNATAKSSHCLPPCRICGERASGFHYGVNTCEACKGFFRRSIRRLTDYKCVELNNQCVIEPGKRNICPKCRFDKCVKAGMSKSAIKTGRYTHEKRSQDIREVKKLEKQVVEDTVPIVIEHLNVEESKNLFELLVHAQKEMYGTNYEFWTSDEMIRKLILDYNKQYKVKMDIFGDLNKLPQDEFKTFYNTTGIDIDNRIELMSEIATTLENGVTRYINFVKCIPGFCLLSLEDQAALIKVSRFEFWFLGYQRFVSPELGVATGVHRHCHHKLELAKVIGTEFAEELFIHSKKMQELKLTVEYIAVLRAFVLFSPDRCVLQNREAVEDIQWRLLMCMKYLFELNHKPEEHYMAKVMDRVTDLRQLTELNEKRAESIKLEWPILKNHPLLVELMSG